MNLEIEAFEGELRELRKVHKIVIHLLAEKLSNTFFICGEGGKTDNNGLPERIFVTPAYGVDWFQVYNKSDLTG